MRSRFSRIFIGVILCCLALWNSGLGMSYGTTEEGVFIQKWKNGKISRGDDYSHLEIPTYQYYNIDAICAEDLIYYGYDMVWDDKTRTTTLTFNPEKEVVGLKSHSLKDGKTYKSDVKIMIDGKLIPSHNTGGYSLIEVRDVNALTQLYVEPYTWIGAPINRLLSTDIATYIHGEQIPSFNINGRTVIFAKDLHGLGFNVKFNDLEKVVYIDKTGKFDKINHREIPKEGCRPVGTIIDDVLVTKIQVKLEGETIKSFNIRGFTAIYVQDLKSVATIKFDESTRKVNIEIK
ncbi:hypothetical protein [Thermotalea metallivorans]|uniref:Uncharacterized protein n=1 Tax=Thermotalea metallivorans TaxID=520762 RepID=A0A140LEI0_9FIRM|nr:hypothetical protein [Thermotalea metallivorans]KXG78955.1 hypothetical protein AN619_01150 [Thermotalea metallivorans]